VCGDNDPDTDGDDNHGWLVKLNYRCFKIRFIHGGQSGGGVGSVVKHSIADPGIASSTPLTPTKITKTRRYVLEQCSRVSVLYTGHVKEPGLSCVVGASVSCTMGN